MTAQTAMCFEAADDRPRRQTQKDRVLTMLRNNDWVTNADFCRAFIPNFRSRISDLRRDGYVITEGECVSPSVWRYRLEGQRG